MKCLVFSCWLGSLLMALQLHVLTYVTGGYTEHRVYLSQPMVLHCLLKVVGGPGSGQMVLNFY